MKFKVIHKTKIRTKPSNKEGKKAGEINPGFVFDVVEEVYAKGNDECI